MKEQGKDVSIRCLFNDRDPNAYERLKDYMDEIEDIKIKTVCRDFEDLIPDIVSFVGDSISVTFIDPKGWTGFGLQQIQPLLRLRGEDVINFMFDFTNRFLEDGRIEISESFNPTFAGPGWLEEIQAKIAQGIDREDAIVSVYCERIQKFGNFSFATSTRILKPITDRSYFHLVYATNHWKGLVEFRNSEKRMIDAQEQARDVAKILHRIERTGQQELFPGTDSPTNQNASQIQRENQLKIGVTRLREFLQLRSSAKYEDILGEILEIPMVWKTDIDDWLKEMRSLNEIEIPELTGRARSPRLRHTINWLEQ